MKEIEIQDLQALTERAATLSDDELFNMINVDYERYRPESLAIAREEMLKRGYKISRRGKVTARRKTGQQSDGATRPGEETQPRQEPKQLLCQRCRIRLEYVGTRRMHEDKALSVLGELGEMFKKGAHEFLDVYVCRRCGRVELFVDGIGDELRPY
ncbi:MAG TPA: hypothetical protein VJH03_17585 [Blastocatellia bacterium]|nr:hypothetical protein [Blastocatellia bacterium]